jgi:hypothetical protein
MLLDVGLADDLELFICAAGVLGLDEAALHDSGHCMASGGGGCLTVHGAPADYLAIQVLEQH